MRYPATLLIIAGAFAAACAGESTVNTTTPSEPWTLEDVQIDAGGGIRVLVLHDMEGLAGQDDPLTFEFGSELYSLGQDLLVGDVNAVIEGLYAGGATEVQVVDGHGSGNPDPDILSDKLDPRATQVFRDSTFDTYFDLVEPDAYDAVAVVGMHAKTGSGGFASHTYTLGIDIILNDQSITETELVALSWGRVGVPVIFGSGDDKLAADLQTMPWIEFVTVKEATSASTANPRPLDEARAALTAGARRAVENLASAKVMKISAPIKATLRAVPPASLERMEGFPGIDYAENAVTFQTDDLHDAYLGLQKIINVARLGYRSVFNEQLRALPNIDDIAERYSTALFARWLDYESGRWQPPEPSTPPRRSRYHGYQ